MGRLIIDGNSIYELDEECLKEKELKKKQELHTELYQKNEVQNKDTQRR